MKPHLPPMLRKALLSAICAIGISFYHVQAATYVGTSDWNWATGSNWNTGTAPNAVGAEAGFNLISNGSLAGKTISVAGDVTVGKLIATGKEDNAKDELQLGGSGVLVFDNGAGTASLEMTGGLDLTVANDIRLNSNFLLNNDSNRLGMITLNGAVNLNGKNMEVSVGSSYSSTGITGIISGTGNLTKTGAGTLILGGANTFTGGVNFQSGIIAINSDTAFGAAANVITLQGSSGKTFSVASTRTIDNSLVLEAASSTLTVDGGGSLTFNSAAGSTFGNATNTALVVQENTTLGFGADNAITSAGRITKSGKGELVLGSLDNDFNGLTITAGTVSTRTYSGEVVLGSASAGKNILGKGAINVQGTNMYGDDVILELNGDSSSTTTFNGTVNVINGAMMIINSGDIRLTGGTLNFGTGSMKGNVMFNGNVWLGSTTLQNASGSFFTFSGDANFLNGSGIAGTAGLQYDFVGAGSQQINVETAGGNLAIAGRVNQKGSGTTTIGNVGSVSFGGLEISEGTFNLGSTATATVTGGITLNGGTLAFGKANQFLAGAINASGTTSVIDLAGFSQGFGGINLAANTDLTLQLGGATGTAVTANLGTLTMGTGSMLRIRDYTAGEDVIRASASNLSNVWFYGYNKGATMTGGVITPGSRLTVEFSNQAAGNQWKWGQAGNWRNTADGSVDDFNIPNAPGVSVTFNSLAGDLVQKTVSLEGGTWTVGTLNYNYNTNGGYLTLGTGRLIFDSGVAGTAAQLNMSGAGAGFYFAAPITLNSDLLINTTSSWPYIAGGITSTATGTDPLTGEQYGRVIKTGTGDLRIQSTGFGNLDRNVHLRAGYLQLYANNLLGKGTIVTQGGGIRTQFVSQKFTVSNPLRLENDFVTYRISYTYAGDIDLSLGGTFSGLRKINVADSTTVAGERASTTFGKDFNFIGAAGLEKIGAHAMEILSANNSFSGGLTVSNGKLYTTLGSDLLLGGVLAGGNYLGTGDITVTGANSRLIVATEGYGTTLTNGNFILQNGGGMQFDGTGEVLLSSGTLNGGVYATKGSLVAGGDLVFDGITIANSPNVTLDAAEGDTEVRATAGKGTITGLGVLGKSGPNASLIGSSIASLGVISVHITGGTLKLGASNQISDTASLRLSGGLFDANGFTQSLGQLQLTTDSGLLLGSSGKLTFASAGSGLDWSSTAQLNIQSSDTGNDWINTKYVRLSDASTIGAAQLANISFTGYESGAQKVNQGGYTYLTPSGNLTSEWVGNDLVANWSAGSNWLGAVPNSATASASIRDIDANLSGKTILVNGSGFTVNRLNLESTGGQSFTIGGTQTLTFDGANARIRHSGGSTVNLVAAIKFDADTLLDLQVNPSQGYLAINGALSGTGDLTLQGNGILRISGNNTNYTGAFLWNDHNTVIQVVGNGTATPPAAAIFGSNLFQIGEAGKTYILESYGTSATVANRSSHISTDFSLGGNLTLRKQTENGVAMSDSTGLDLIRMELSGDGVIESGDHVINVYGNSTNLAVITEYMRLSLTGNLSGDGNITHNGAGRLDFYGQNNENYTGNITLKSGIIGLKHKDSLGKGLVTVDSIGQYHLRFQADQAVSLSNPFHFALGAQWQGSAVTLDYDGSLSDSGGNAIVTTFNGTVDWGNYTTITFGKDNRITGTGLLRQGSPGGYTPGGTTRFLSPDSDWSGGVILHFGTIQAGASSVWQGDPGGTSSVWRNGVLQTGNLVSGPIGTGTLNLGTSGTFSAYSDNAAVKAQRISNDVVLSSNSIFGRAGSAVRTIFDNNTVTLRSGIGDLVMNVTSGTFASFESQLVDNASYAGGITKTGAGTLELGNGNNQIAAGIQANAGIVRAVQYAYNFASSATESTGIATGNVTIGKVETDQNYLGTGVLYTNASGAGYEVLTTDGSTVTIAKRADGQDTMLLNKGGVFKVTGGTGVITELENGLTLRVTEGALGTFSSTGTIYANNLNLGVKMASPNLEVRSNRTITFAQANLISGTTNLTLNAGSVLKVGGFNQTLGGSLTLNGAATLDFSGYGAVNAQFTLSDIITASGSPSGTVLNIVDWKSHPTSGVGLNQIIIAWATGSQIFDNVSFGSQYTRGGVTRYMDGVGWILTPMGQSYYWDGRSNDSWVSANWRTADANGVINPTTMQPITAGEIAVFGNLDTGLNGTTVSLGSSAFNIGSITIDNNTATAFTIGTTAGPKLVFNGAGAATAINMASGSTANVTINANIDLYSTTANAGTLGMSINQNGSGKLTINGVIEGLQSVTKTGAGVLELSGANRFTYGFNLQNGRVVVAANGGTSSGPLGDGWLTIGTASTASITLEASGGARTLGANHVRINNDFSVEGDLSFTNATRNGEVAANSTITLSSSDTLRMANKFTGTGQLTKAGNGTLELSGDSTGYAAGINLSGGTLAAGSHMAAGTNKALGTGALHFNGDATLTNNASTVNKVKSLSNAISIVSGKKATIDTSGGDLALTGALTGAGSMIKTGANTLTLSAASSYSGGTKVTTGTLKLTGATSAGTGAITNDAGAVTHIALTSTGTVTNAIANAGALTITGNNTTLSGVISGAGTVTVSGTGTVISGINTTTGLWTIAAGGSATYSNNANFGTSGVNVAGALSSTGSGNIAFNHALTGSGVFNIGNTGGFSFGASTGNAFAGTINVNSNANLTWNANASTAFANSNLVLRTGSVTTMNPSPQSAKKLTLDGGRLNVGTGTVNVTNLQVNTTGAQIVFDTGRFQNEGLVEQNILSNQTIIHSANAWTGSGGLANISLVKSDGTSVANPTILDITQSSAKVAEGTYTNAMNKTGNDLNLSYQLTAVKIMGDKTLLIAQGNGKGAQNFDAKITGTNANSNLTLTAGTGAGDSLTLTKTADHTGSTTIAGGTVKAGIANVFGANKGLIVNSGTFDLNGFAQTIKGLDGTGGTVALGASGLTINGGGAYAGIITGTTGALTKTGTASLTLNGNNTYNGATNVNAGKLILGGNNTGTGGVTVANSAGLQVGTGTSGMLAANITNNGSVEFNRSNASTYAGVISGTGTLDKTGAGVLTLNKANTYTGATTISGGSIKAGIADIIKNSSSLTLAANTTFDLANTNQQVNNLTSGAATSKVTLGSGKLTANNTADTTFAGVISGTGAFDKTGTGTLTLGNANTFTGATTISGGSIKAGIADIIKNSSSLTLAVNTTFDLANTNQQVNNLTSSAATSKVTLGSGKLTANNTASTTFAGVISGSGAFDKTGNGVLTLSNANTLTGATTISGGTLKAGANNIIAQSSGVTIALGAELAVNGTTQSINNLASSATTSKVTLGTNGNLTLNNSSATTFAGAISGAGAVAKAGNQTLTLSGASSYTGTTSVTAGLLKLTNAAAAGTSALTVTPVVAGTGLELAFNGATFSNNIGGAGRVTISGSNVKLGGANTLSGIWNITGSAEASSNANLGTAQVALNGTGSTGVLNLKTVAPADWSFNNQLTGTGTMNVDLGAVNQRLSFGTGVGSAFTGTVNMTRGTMTLDSTAAGSFTNGTLKLTGTGNAYNGGVAEVAGTGTRAINNLTMAGGTLQVNFTGKTPDAMLNVNTLDATGGGYLAANGINGIINQDGASSSNFFDDSGNANRYQIKAVGANTINGNTQLVLVDGTGSVLTGGQKTSAISEGGTTTGTAYYDYVVTTGMNPNGSDKGVFIGYGLKRIDAASGQQVTLANGSSTGTLDAQLTGTGGFIVNGTGNVSLGNAASNYTGNTQVNSGNILLQTNNAFGATGKLAIAAPATVNLQGNSQTVGQLDNGGSIILGNGTLTITNGGTSTGVLSGAGVVNLTGGTLTVVPANTGLTANVNLTGNSIAVLNHVASLGNSGTLSIASGSTAQLSGATGDLRKVLDGDGTVALASGSSVTLNANNSGFTGNFTIASGTSLTSKANMHLGGGTVTIASGGELILNADTSWGMNTGNTINGDGKVVKTGMDTLTINHANTYTGGTDITGGIVRLGNGSALGTGLVSFTDDATLEMGGNNLTVANQMDIAAGKTAELLADGVRTGTLSGNLGGAGAIAKSGTGTMILTGTNTYAGGTTILAGKLQLGNGGLTGTVIGDIINNAALEFNYGSGANLAYAGAITGTGTLAKTSAGTVTLSGTNSYNGTTTVAGGKLILTGTNTGTGQISVSSGATIQIGNAGATGSIAASGITNNGAVIVDRTGSLSYVGAITGTGTLEKKSSGTLTLGGNNSYNGTTTVAGGTLVLTGTNTGTGLITVASATTLQLGDGGTTGMVNANIASNGAILVDRSNADVYNGIISGTGTLAKNGAGILTLGGNSSYTGSTAVNAGGLKLTHQEATGTGMVTLAANTGLELAFSNATYDNSLTGSGKVTTTGSNINVTADNNASGFAGPWDVKSGSSVHMSSLDNIGTTGATINVDGTLNINVNSLCCLDRILTGSGDVNVTLGSSVNAMTFSTHATCNSFTGNMKLAGGNFELGNTGQAAINTGAMANATLVISTDHTTRVNNDASIGGLTFDGGTLDLQAHTATNTAELTVGHLDVESGTNSTVNIDASRLGTPQGVEPTVNFMDADDVTNGGMKVAHSSTVSSEGKHLGLTVNGNASPYAADIVVSDGVNHDIIATYDYRAIASAGTSAGQGAGLYVDYVLTKLESVTNLILSNASASDSTLAAQLTGSGDVTINDSKSGIILTNNSNDYTGVTYVTSGKLVSGVDEALGQTTGLDLAAGTVFDLNGYSQTVDGDVVNDDALVMIGDGFLTVNGSLDVSGTSPGMGRVDVGTGTLKLNGGGTLAGNNALTGQAGSLVHVDPSDLVVNGDNANYKGDVLIDGGSSITLDHVDGLGANAAGESGKVTIAAMADDNANGVADRLALHITDAANAGELTKQLEGSGILSVDTVADVVINRENTDFDGEVEVDNGNVVATSDKAAGTGKVIVKNDRAFYTWRDLASGSTIVNEMSGDGTVMFDHSAARIAAANTAATVDVRQSALEVDHANGLGSATSKVSIDSGSQVTMLADATVLGDVDNAGSMTVDADRLHAASLANNGSFAFGSPATAVGGFRNAFIDSLSGNGTLVFNVNFSELTPDLSTPPSGYQAGDHLTVNNSATGTQTVVVKPVGDLPESGNGRISLITTSNFVAGPDAFKLPTNLEGRETADIGSFAYTLRQGDGSEALPSANDWYLVGDSLSKQAEAVMGTAAAMGLGFHAEMNSLMQRMGDLRLSQRRERAGQLGIDTWVRTYAWETNVGNRVSGTPFRETYYGADAGFDKNFKRQSGYLYTGAFFGMGKSDREFNGFGGGSTDAWKAGLYGSYVHRSGWYVDVVGKLNHYENKFDSISTYGDVARGDYKQYGFGFSVETGKQFVDEDGWFAEPQVQVSYARIEGKNYTTQGFIPVGVDLEAQDSFQARAGIRLGKNVVVGGCIFQPYVKGSAVGMWTHGGRVTTSDGLSRRATLDGARMEIGAGVIWDLPKYGQFYVDYEYNRAERYETPWKVNVGYRVSW